MITELDIYPCARVRHTGATSSRACFCVVGAIVHVDMILQMNESRKGVQGSIPRYLNQRNEARTTTCPLFRGALQYTVPNSACLYIRRP